MDTAELRAAFNPLIKPFLVLRIGIPLAMSIVGIPLALAWFLGVGRWWAQHYFDKLECRLTPRALHFRKGILVQVEKTIPLENLQDVTFVEGPILRRFQLATLKFETAGHSAGQASDMHLTGIIDAHEFRNRILVARDALRQQHAPGAADAHLEALRAIERQLAEIAALLRRPEGNGRQA
jgi:putative membrane protein